MNHDLETLAQTAASWQPGPLGTMREVGDLMAWAVEEMERLQREVDNHPRLRTPEPGEVNPYDYQAAMSGEGPHADTWKDKPHRLVYDLCGEVERLQARYKESLDLIRHDTTIIARLRAIVDKLPQCWRLNDDGESVQDCPVVPLMDVWLANKQLWTVESVLKEYVYLLNNPRVFPVCELYSTPEAAEKAKETDA